MLVWSEVLSALDAAGRCVLVSILDVAGSSPREAGARMVVRPDMSFKGTIGGGRLEYDLLHEAVSMMKRGQTAFVSQSYALGPDLGQCCGGRVQVALEQFDLNYRGRAQDFSAQEVLGNFSTIANICSSKSLERQVLSPAMCDPNSAEIVLNQGKLTERFGQDRPHLYLFGAGHVGKALVHVLAPLGFQVSWIDERREIFPEYVPSNIRCIHLHEPQVIVKNLEPGNYILVMTHDHKRDHAIVDAAVRRTDMAYIGLIGSATKRARTLKRFKDSGLSEAHSKQLVCPVGITEIRSKKPSDIAISIAAQLLVVKDQQMSAAKGGFRFAS
ncbi:putative xanthine dehydrogenase subunit A [Pseudovibrio axinellae]|uniref:Putative xanthine dehydrogenase subunit A n=1 Tax=Pseudovibrio axinellae TaxID=989403 RepID=A0A165XC45_9HYPH|nr:xanthine dehydrogenase accessory protein XdhC [Pseudovibrio axinellae]KZL17561.1 putative xanthine dehydrogenase subunit A [Pseudovibrio axinellae]SER32668.1 molybdenum cofactor sulfurylase [Pseudovibrio axinellae]